MEPWGSLALTGYSCENFQSRTNQCHLLSSNDKIRPSTRLDFPSDLSLGRRPACQTLLKVLDIPSATIWLVTHLMRMNRLNVWIYLAWDSFITNSKLVLFTITAQKMKFSITDLVTFTEEIRNRKLHFLCYVQKIFKSLIGTFWILWNIYDRVFYENSSRFLAVNYFR